MLPSIPLVSVVVPVYNEEKCIEFCLSSLLNQSYKDTEIIVVDDGSTDGSVNIVQKYNVKLLQQKHKGPGAARNLGVKHAQGKVLVFADADMRYSGKYIENLVKPIFKKEAIGTFIKEELVANPGNVWSRCWSINNGLPPNRRLPEDYPETERVFRAIRKDYFDRVKGFNENEGYMDDQSLSKKLNLQSVNSKGAVSYHYNPSTLIEVFYQARWIGRGAFKPNLKNFYIHSPAKSLYIGIRRVLSGAPISIIPFKLVYDFGILTGIFMSNGKKNK